MRAWSADERGIVQENISKTPVKLAKVTKVRTGKPVGRRRGADDAGAERDMRAPARVRRDELGIEGGAELGDIKMRRLRTMRSGDGVIVQRAKDA